MFYTLFLYLDTYIGLDPEQSEGSIDFKMMYVLFFIFSKCDFFYALKSTLFEIIYTSKVTWKNPIKIGKKLES